MIRLGLFLIAALVLAAPAAWADPGTSDGATVAVKASAPGGGAEAKPTAKARRRLTTSERWRGKPYLSAEDSLLRAQALDKAIPAIQNGYASGGAFGFQGIESEEQRQRALDRAMPISLNPSFRSGF